METTRPPKSALLESSLAPSLMQERLALVCTDHDTLNETWWCLTNLPSQSRANRQNECESASSCVLLWTDILWTDGIVHVLNGADPSIARCTPVTYPPCCSAATADPPNHQSRSRTMPGDWPGWNLMQVTMRLEIHYSIYSHRAQRPTVPPPSPNKSSTKCSTSIRISFSRHRPYHEDIVKDF